MPDQKPVPKFQLLTSRNFEEWLQSQNISISFTTYQGGKIFMLGKSSGQPLHVTERSFSRCMGLGFGSDVGTFWMSSEFQIWKFQDTLSGSAFKDYDRVYIPQVSYTTGDVDVHDIIINKENQPIFVNTLFNCLATVSDSHSFKVVWKPPFITDLVAEDRCHLNGLAQVDGDPAYVTMVSESNAVDGWRDYRADGGIVMDIRTNEVVCRGLSMPHSPRWYKGQLYLLEAGSGYLGRVNFETNTFERLAFCPGFLRGLDFIGDQAIVGLSGVRENKTFDGLELDKNLEEAKAKARCGLHVINLETNNSDHWVRTEGVVDELYDVKVLKGVKKPLIIGTKKDEIKTFISIEK